MKAIIKQALDNYGTDGVPTGGFLRAVLSNDLFLALRKADIDNQHDIFEIVHYVYNELPGNCWGSKEAVAAWLEKKDDERRDAAADKHSEAMERQEGDR